MTALLMNHQSCRRRLCPRSPRILLCILSLATMLRPISAFQLLQRTTTFPSHRAVATTTCLSSNKDPVVDNISDPEKEVPLLLETTSVSDFGESVPYVPLSQRNQQVSSNGDSGLLSVEGGESNEVDLLQQNRIRNIAVAIASFAFAIFNYGWQFTHPVTAIEILATMQSQSAPLTAVGNNGKPTVIDFWAPWCGNCKVGAPTLQAVEKEYGDRVNFLMVNADDGKNWPLIQLFGVDAIPHLALLSGEGDVETALIGPTSRNVLRADIDALLNKREGECEVEKEIVQQPICHDELPYKMYDAFGNKPPESRRINFVEAFTGE